MLLDVCEINGGHVVLTAQRSKRSYDRVNAARLKLTLNSDSVASAFAAKETVSRTKASDFGSFTISSTVVVFIVASS